MKFSPSVAITFGISSRTISYVICGTLDPFVAVGKICKTYREVLSTSLGALKDNSFVLVVNPVNLVDIILHLRMLVRLSLARQGPLLVSAD